MSEPNLSVDYFRDVLRSETKNLSDSCEKWSKILENQTLKNDVESQEELLGAIRSTIGKAKLLMSQRFKQFSTLIDDCQHNTGQHLTKLTDLSGFWDMISIQVEEVHSKFKSLEVTHSGDH